MFEFSPWCAAKRTLISSSDHAAAARSSLSDPRATNHKVRIRRRPLQSLGLVPWRTHPNVALFVGFQDYRHYLGMYRLDDRISITVAFSEGF
jgi:hypothetical protein